MTKACNWIREDLHTLTPRIVYKNAEKAIEFYEKAFGAKRRMVSKSPQGNIMHAEIQVGNSVLFMVDEVPHMGCMSHESIGQAGFSLYLAVEDVDSSFKKAVDAGCTVKMPVADMFWGDRYGVVVDPFGNSWELATHKEDLSQSEIEERAKAAFCDMAKAK